MDSTFAYGQSVLNFASLLHLTSFRFIERNSSVNFALSDVPSLHDE